MALTIAGSDPSGGAGIQADLKTFHRFGVFGEAVLALITVQNTMGLARVARLPADFVIAQINVAIADIPPQAAKTGALGSEEVIEAIASRAAEFTFPLVVDPVMFSKDGTALLGGGAGDALTAMRSRLLPRAHLITPNLEEAARLTGRAVGTLDEMRIAAKMLCDLGARAALVKGGHLPESGDAVDILYASGNFQEFRSPRIATRNTHGTGCTYSAAITAGLAAGVTLEAAIEAAKDFVTRAIASNPGLGQGAGPLNHWA